VNKDKTLRESELEALLSCAEDDLSAAQLGITTLQQALEEAENIPKGWALVPVEPTLKMQEEAAFNLCNDYDHGFVRDSRHICLDAYSNLVAAAKPPGE
jgi:hypothetical protein